MKAKRVNYELIVACKEGNSEALRQVVRHFEPMINSAASKTIESADGTKKIVVDDEIKQQIEQTLMLQIFLKYDHLATLEQMRSRKRAK